MVVVVVMLGLGEVGVRRRALHRQPDNGNKQLTE